MSLRYLIWRLQQRRARTRSLKFFQWLHVFWNVAQRVGRSWQGWHWLGVHRLCGGTRPWGQSEDLDMASPGLCWGMTEWGLCLRLMSQWLRGGWGLHHFFCPMPSRAPIIHSSQSFGIPKIPKVCILVQNLHELSDFISLCFTFFSFIVGLEIVCFDHLKWV